MNTITSWYQTPWSQRHWLVKVALLVGATVTGLGLTSLGDVWLAGGTGALLAQNQLVTPTWVMKEIGRILVNNLKFAANVQRSYDDQYVKAGAKMGFTVNARLPQRYKVNKGQALNPQPVVDNVVPITLTDQANIGIEFSTASLTMEVDSYREKAISPAVASLTNAVDFDGCSRMYLETFHTVGTPQSVPTANQVYLDAGVKLDNNAVAAEDRVAILSPAMHAAIANANIALFNPASQISEYFRKGQFGAEALGIAEWYKDQNVATHTVGPLGGTPLVVGAAQTGASINTDGWTAAAAKRLNKGDVIQFDGVDATNPQSYQSTGLKQDFVVTADVSSDSAGLATIPISPSLLDSASGALQTVSAAPADNAIITIFGHASTHASKVSPQGLVYHPEAYALVMADLEMPQGLWVAEKISNKALGIAIRFLKDYSIMTDLSPARVDILYGWKAVRPEMGCRIAG